MVLQLSLPNLPPASTEKLRTLQTTNGKGDGIFGWYRYVQDFTGEFATQWLGRIANPGKLVWDPFAGSGTTLVAAKYLGIESVGYDASPFMVDVARTKIDWTISRKKILAALERVGSSYSSQSRSEPDAAILSSWRDYDSAFDDADGTFPMDPKLRKWISPDVARSVQALSSELDSIRNERERRFLRLALASILIPASNMTFRPNICYKPRPVVKFPLWLEFSRKVREMLADYQEVFGRKDVGASAHVGNARTDGPDSADVIFTSPPYPNDMEYVHQTRLELLLLGYLGAKKDLTTLKKEMISSSVKLVYRENDWQKTMGLEVPSVRAAYENIAETLVGRNWGWNPADMTAQYFGGMRRVLQNWSRRLAPGGTAAVVIGDSAFNGVKVATDVLLADTARIEGFIVEDIEVFRTRWNSKHDIELRESVVVLRNK